MPLRRAEADLGSKWRKQTIRSIRNDYIGDAPMWSDLMAFFLPSHELWSCSILQSISHVKRRFSVLRNCCVLAQASLRRAGIPRYQDENGAVLFGATASSTQLQSRASFKWLPTDGQSFFDRQND